MSKGHQQWTAIAIEFVIVVIGVFVGLQMSNWTEARIQAADEQATLLRLQEGFGSIEAELIEVADQYASTLESTGLVIETLRAAVPPSDHAAFRNALRESQFVWDVPAQSTTYAELVATGALSRLSNPELRAALTRYGDYAARYARKLPVALALILDPNSNLQSTGTSTPTRGRHRRASSDTIGSRSWTPSPSSSPGKPTRWICATTLRDSSMSFRRS